jgi:hypothetical protein
MLRLLYAAVVAAFVLSGWTVPSAAAPKSYLTADGIARMMAADGIKAQWYTAKHICLEKGLALGTDGFLDCFSEYQLHSLRALRTRARGLTEEVARKHGLCIDRIRFEFARCKEI